jgi:hypothetical protein
MNKNRKNVHINISSLNLLLSPFAPSRNFSINHFTHKVDILNYIKENPTFLSGFTSGEGCFTAYMGMDKGATWGLQPGCEFVIAQKSGDLILMEAINEYFDNKCTLYTERKDEVLVLMSRNLITLNNLIIPFFVKYPLVGTKSYELEKFKNLVELILTKKHIGTEASNRDVFLEMCLIIKELNSKVINNRKSSRLDIIMAWLKDLSSFPPTLEDKERLYNLLQSNLAKYKKALSAQGSEDII